MIKAWTGVLTAVALAATLTACSTPQQTNAGSQATTTSQTQATTQQSQAPASTPAHSDMATTDHQASGQASKGEHNMPYDAEFLDMMGYHHEDALTMARQALDKAEMSEVREMAKGIIADQEAEIKHMKSLRSQWYPDVPVMAREEAAHHMQHFDLSQGEGSFDDRFLNAMIGHHKDALTMAQEAQTKAEHAELKKMAKEMYAKQEKEIAQMRRMLETADR
jgi:uncharacterized protein (DUF305 family)